MNNSNETQDHSRCAANDENDLIKKLKCELHEEFIMRSQAENESAILRGRVAELESKLSLFSSSSASSKPTAKKSESAADAGAIGSPPDAQSKADDNVQLQAENDRLRGYIKRQNALIDVLRRQKILLEAASALTITAKDFGKDLELEKL